MDFQKELIAEYERELAITRKILDAIPDDADFSWKPHPKSSSLGALAAHVSGMAGQWAVYTLTMDRLDWTAEMKTKDPANKTELLAQFDREVAEARPVVESFEPAKWDSNWKLVSGDQTWIDDTKYRVWRSVVMNHMVHHRAQLGVYLRLLDQKLPGTYGPSADEM